MIDKLNAFFNQKGINKKGLCEEIGISEQHLQRVLLQKNGLTEKTYKKILKIIVNYGYVESNI